MKKSLIALISAVSALLVFGLSSCGNSTNGSSDTAEVVAETLEVSTSDAPSNTIAYIHLDSLVADYAMYIDLSAKFEEKAAKVEKELTSKGRRFEKDVADFQEKVEKGLITRSQGATMQEELQRRQQEFVQNRDAAMQEMAEEERVLLNNIQYNIIEYLKEFNADKRYGIIISTSVAGPILNADPALDITAKVLEGLNKKYAAEVKTER